MHMVSLVCVLFHLFGLIWMKASHTDRRTDHWMDGQTVRHSFRDTTTHLKASRTGTRARMDRYVCVYTGQLVRAHMYTVTHTRRRNIL